MKMDCTPPERGELFKSPGSSVKQARRVSNVPRLAVTSLKLRPQVFI